MFGIKELKEKIEITETTVECPVKGCKESQLLNIPTNQIIYYGKKSLILHFLKK